MIRVLFATLALLFVTDERTTVTGFFDLPVTGGTATFEMLGLYPEERGHAIGLLVRELFTQSASAVERSAGVRSFVGQLSRDNAQKSVEGAGEWRPLTIAAPLTADHWRDVLQLPARADVFAALINSRSAMLVCAGLMSTDPSIRAFLERDRGLLRWIVRTTPAAFWLSARALKLERDRIAVPGGPEMEPIWEALAGVKVTRPADFLRAMLTKDAGRLAWFYDSVATMSAQRIAAVKGAPPLESQLKQMTTLYTAFRNADTNWKLEEHPFLRGTTDPWIATTQIEIRDAGVAGPAPEWFWQALFERADLTRRVAGSIRREPSSPVTIAWLAQKISGAGPKERRDRFEMVRFAQGVFAGVDGDDLTETVVALGGYRRYRALLLSLDRMDVVVPRAYARAVEAARRLDDDLSGRDERNAVVAFQAAVAIVERARLTRAIDARTATSLVLSLADAIDRPAGAPKPRDARPSAVVVQWMLTTMLDALPALVQPDQWTTAKTAYESRLLQALAGPPGSADAPTMQWEGLEYRVDWFGAEHARLKRIREQLESPGLDAAIERNDHDQIASALQALIYAPALGDPEGQALLGGDIAQRHNFGLTGPAGMRREYIAWALPREQVGDGTPWHIEGALLGLDIALARLALRRIADNEMPVAPTINLNDQLTLARTILTINPRNLRDADRDRIVASIARGRKRVADAGANLMVLRALADEAQWPAAMRQSLPWTVARMPDAAPSLFTLRDFFWLGRPDMPQDALDYWGVYAEGLTNRLRTAMPVPAPWDNFGGRADGGLIATQAPDLILRMAEETARLKLPAQLIPALLMYAAQDYWHDVESRFPDDWPAMTRQALALSPSRVEDYVAALAGAGPLRPK
ncbi:MAG TPA: hypothetical protein VEA16_14125 [Vicinamibacterales bacterium]|nr:hypothetical protein [Vicinamibacterales bacterium]